MHFTSADREEIMLALGKTIGLLDQIAAVDDELQFMDIRRQLVNAYLDVLAERLRPYDQSLEVPDAPTASFEERRLASTGPGSQLDESADEPET